MRLGCFLVFVILGAAPALAQPDVGIKAGPTVSRLDKADGSQSPTRVGFAIGGAVEVSLAAMLSLQVEGLYSEKGEADPDGEPPFRDVKLAYLEVPVTLVLTVPAGGVEARLSAGGFAGRRVTDDVGRPGGTARGTDAGALLGVGLRKGPVVLDARYEVGLRDVQPVNLVGEARTRTLALTLGYRLGGR